MDGTAGLIIDFLEIKGEIAENYWLLNAFTNFPDKVWKPLNKALDLVNERWNEKRWKSDEDGDQDQIDDGYGENALKV